MTRRPPPQAAPQLTFPPDVADVVRSAYAAARSILEYGSGGSTVLAAQSGTPCISVENDLAWADQVKDWLDHAHPGHRVTLHRVYIGPTRKWGRPSRKQAPLWRWRYPAYPRSVWRRRDMPSPDVILIDGRFRPACFLTALAHISAPATILWDDYAGRPEYGIVERHVPVRERIGRMAVFDAHPGAITPADLAAAKPLFHNPE